MLLQNMQKGPSEFIELDDGSLIHVRDEGNKNGRSHFSFNSWI